MCDEAVCIILDPFGLPRIPTEPFTLMGVRVLSAAARRTAPSGGIRRHEILFLSARRTRVRRGRGLIEMS